MKGYPKSTSKAWYPLILHGQHRVSVATIIL